MSPRDSNAFHDELIQNYLENQATPTEEEQFRLLLGEQSFRRRVAEYSIDLGCLYSHARQGMLDGSLGESHLSTKRPYRRVLAIAAIAAFLLLAIAGPWSLSHLDRGPSDCTSRSSGSPLPEPFADRPKPSAADVAAERPGIALAAHVIGQVVASGSSNPAQWRAVEEGASLQSGDILRTVDDESFALVEFHDGTVLAVAGESQLACTLENSRKRVNVSSGDVMAQVAPQDKLSPMVITTPNAQAEVLGTRLSMYTNAAMTELAVHEGRVLFRRLDDGQTIDISEGYYALAETGSDLVAQLIQSVPSVWEVDFESGLPERWRHGIWVRGNMLADSNGAVRAVVRPEDQGNQITPCFVMTGKEWSHGLFCIEDDTHLNFRYKMSTPGWFYVMVSTRTDQAVPVFAGSCIYKNRDMWEIPRNQWKNACIPLSRFQKPKTDPPHDAPKTGDLVFSLHFRTQDQDPGLMIDRIWVTRGAPESAEVLGPSD